MKAWFWNSIPPFEFEAPRVSCGSRVAQRRPSNGLSSIVVLCTLHGAAAGLWSFKGVVGRAAGDVKRDESEPAAAARRRASNGRSAAAGRCDDAAAGCARGRTAPGRPRM